MPSDRSGALTRLSRMRIRSSQASTGGFQPGAARSRRCRAVPSINEEADVRVRWFRCRTRELPTLPKRDPGSNLRAWMLEQTRVFPRVRPGCAVRLSPALEWGGNGGRW